MAPRFPNPEVVPVPEWHRRVLEDRLVAYRADPGDVIPWEEVREDLLRKLKDRRQPRKER
jgi:hypothetical protein